MAVDRATTIRGSINWSQSELTSLSRISDVGQVGTDIVLESGDFNCVFHAVGIMPSGGSQLLDLSNLQMSIFNEDVSFGMTTIKGICIENRADPSGNLFISATGTGMFIEPWQQAISGVPVYRNSSYVGANPDGWTISTNKKLILRDSGMGVPYSISLVGNSG